MEETAERSQVMALEDFRFEHDEWLIVVLDACRYDILKRFLQREEPDLAERLERVRSPATYSPEWGYACWTGDYSDVTYITTNAHFSEEHGNAARNRYQASNHLGETVHRPVNEPQELVKEAVERKDRDKIVVHMMKPHQPYYYPSGERRDESLDKEGTPLWKWIRAYTENLEFGWDAGVSPLLRAFDRPTVVTADHGECFNRREGEDWLHGEPLDYPEVRNVPWLTWDEPDSNRDAPPVAERRLEELGYL